MRINIYEEEVTGEIELVTKRGVIGADGQPTNFIGVRIFLLSPNALHNNEHDDDRSAVTFWASEDNYFHLPELFDSVREVVMREYDQSN